MNHTLRGQAPGINRRAVGRFVVTAINDRYLELGLDLLYGISPGDASNMVMDSGRKGPTHMPVGVYLVESADETILIDGGGGGVNGWGGRLQGALPLPM